MFAWLRKGKRRSYDRVPAEAVSLQARYEAASPAHANLWPTADGYSADAAASAEVRKVLRERCRTQAENDPICEGLIDTLANDLVGAGPRLQLLTENEDDNDQVENLFATWADAVGLADKLRVMRRARATDGEIFAVLVSNPAVAHPVKLDVKLIEADQVTSPNPWNWEDNAIDGIEFDDHGNPATYLILKDHPGDVHRFGGTIDYDRVPAASVIHYFKRKRAGQSRGIPDLAPALIHFAYLRRWILATLNAADAAASFAGIVKSTAPPNEDTDTPLRGGEEISISRGLFPVLPHQWDLTQLKAEHPTTNHQMFRRECIGDIARCLNMPVNIALLNSGGYNFASGRLDDRIYDTSLGVDRKALELIVVERIFSAFLAEAVLVSDALPLAVRQLAGTGARVPHQWNWTGRDYSVDPQTEAAAATERLNNRTSNLAIEYARRGRDWEEELYQIKAEQDLMAELGLSPAAAAAKLQDPAQEQGQDQNKPDAQEASDE